MQSNLLNFSDAMKLAQIISKYIDLESIKEMTGEEFAYSLFSKMEEWEILNIASFFVVDIQNKEPEEIILSCVDGMIRNGVLDLLETYNQIGFSK